MKWMKAVGMSLWMHIMVLPASGSCNYVFVCVCMWLCVCVAVLWQALDLLGEVAAKSSYSKVLVGDRSGRLPWLPWEKGMSDGLIPNSFTLRQRARRERRAGGGGGGEGNKARGDREGRHESQTAEPLRVSGGIYIEQQERSSLEQHHEEELLDRCSTACSLVILYSSWLPVSVA